MKKMTAIFTVALVLATALSAPLVEAACVANSTPTRINNLRVVTYSDSAIGLAFTVPADASTLTGYDIRYRTDVPLNSLNWSSATQVSGEPIPLPTGESQVHIITNLKPATTHYIGVRATNECGKSNALSNVPQIKTLSTPPDKQIVIFAMIYPKDKEANIDGFKIRYGNVSRHAPGFSGYPSVTEMAKSDRVVTLVFEIGQTYYVSFSSYKNDIDGPYSNEMTIPQ
ncbi:fibronectin type III domain-containing protein [Candidatus Falkowbacteria bacterium]|nr:fibronectin type III domain-containing protein [Candidatus Falkowbacteria bacterium]